MLTENELAWLNERQICLACEGSYIWAGYWEDGVELEIMQEAAEFEDRVAAKLARWDNEYHKDDHLCPYGDDDLDSYIPLCHCTDFCKGHPKLGCVSAKIAWARLAVEEEMDNETNN